MHKDPSSGVSLCVCGEEVEGVGLRGVKECETQTAHSPRALGRFSYLQGQGSVFLISSSLLSP